MNLREALADMKRRSLTDFYPLEKSAHGFYVCPICGSGTGTHETGALRIFDNTKRVYCFAGECFGAKGEDTAGALAILWNCSLVEAATRAGYDIDGAAAPIRSAPEITRRPEPKPKDAAPLHDYTAQYREWNANLLTDEAALDTLHSWGITTEAARHFLVGYAPEWSHSKSPTYKSARFIFPRTRDTYAARKANRADTGPGKYMLEGRQGTLFNTKPLRTYGAAPVFVVEGEIDAVVIWQLGFNVLGLGSITNGSAFVETAKEQNPAALYILALDNDSAGRAAQKAIAEDLRRAGIRHKEADAAALYDGDKDAGDAALKDKKRFYKRLLDLTE